MIAFRKQVSLLFNATFIIHSGSSTYRSRPQHLLYLNQHQQLTTLECLPTVGREGALPTK